ncbi:hypothetical protein GCM10023322_65750 [Rugosimonospora acidiphila]|uniref:Uncharacterized protein n=1 Tax=Rugosimonospora acidiphila TaxID=556531 RepID=A0ABP9SIW5_9ACTN
MLGTQLAELVGTDLDGLAETLDVVAGVDDALVHGLARLDERSTGALAALAGAVAATPLGPRVAEAVEKIAAGSVAGEHLVALAGARTALFGAVHDALLARFDAALGRTRDAWPEPASPPAPPPVAPAPDAPAPVAPAAPGGVAENLLGGCRSWLHELATAGWRGVDQDLVSASGQLIESALAEPGLRRLAVLLDGLAAELRALCPVAAADRLPVRRWADLWARALLLSQPPPRSAGGAQPEPVFGAGEHPQQPSEGEGAATAVSGRLLILGVDVHEHGTAVQVQVHGVLEPAGGGPPRLVRTGVAAAKVDTIVGPAVWRLLRGCPVLLRALAEHRTLDVTDLPLLPGGDLVWHDDRAGAGEVADPFATARVLLATAHAPAVPPLQRHPVRLAEPVLLEGYATGTGEDGELTLELGGHRLDVATDRLPACGPLTAELVAASTACLGLVRWDGGRWMVQPLAVQGTVKRKPVAAHGGDWALGPTDAKVVKAQAKAGDAVAVLRERAGRLLRK